MKKLLSMALALIMVLALVPFSAASAEAQGVTLFGFSDLKFNGGSSVASDSRVFVGFNSEQPSTAQIASGIDNKVSYAADAVDGMIYAYAHEFSDSGIMPDNLYRIDPTTWNSTHIGAVDTLYQVIDMTYAEDRNTMYAMVSFTDNGNYHLMRVDLTTGELIDIANLTELNISISTAFAYIGGGRFFGVTRHQGEGIIFNENGIIQRLGKTINSSYEEVISITNYQPHGCLYAVKAQLLPDGNHAILIKINPATGESEEVGAVGGGYGHALASLFALPGYALTLPDIPTQAEFDSAINAPGSSLTFINDTVYPWAIGTQGSSVYVESTNQGVDNSSSTITAIFNDLTAGQELSFSWMVSSESNYDWLRFYSNGSLVERISGNVSWTAESYTIPADGNYTFTWTYSKDSSASSGSDMGCIDNISISGNQPLPYDPSLAANQLSEALNVEGGSLEFINDLVNPWSIISDSQGDYVESTITQYNTWQTFYFFAENAKAGDAIRFNYKTDSDVSDRLLFIKNNSIQESFSGVNDWQQYTYIIPEDGSYAFSWQFVIRTDDNMIRSANKVWVDDIEYIADYNEETPVNPNMPDAAEFNAAVNAPGESRSFVNDNANPWQIVEDGSRTCAVSNIAGMGDTTTAFTVELGYLEAGTTITFDWKTSTESGWDRACLTLNGYTYMSRSGVNDWTTASYTIENDDYYTLGWQYEKNATDDEGEDCVWVDNIKIVPVQTGEYYTVTFIDGLDNSVISTQTVPEGGSAVPPTPPVHEGYEFVEWSGDYANVTADCTVTAIYEPIGIAGDVNGDGLITSADALIVLRYALGLDNIPAEYAQFADVNEDGLINSSDALLILRISLNIL